MFILNHFDRIKTLVLLDKHFNMFIGNTYLLECRHLLDMLEPLGNAGRRGSAVIWRGLKK